MTNEERKLLELAAKTALIEFTVSPGGDLLAHSHPGGGEMRVWNPLEDDADCFLLMIALRIKLDYPEPSGDTLVAYSNEFDIKAKEPWHSSSYRLAIVRVAAEIGKSQ
ncbi:hypothetical protein Q1W70_00395 [Pseudomonas kielensis]|uniref:hypothetical protein n=1 Tax=Pseudomonas kielensis TaxID=2762577 RepID=UPI00265FFE11|nr:hypothetical protein [Pseudomonas kielensis]WKL53099.1 hypothetical protein Q1W70_00395 [Pseudomonas kielensis]